MKLVNDSNNGSFRRDLLLGPREGCLLTTTPIDQLASPCSYTVHRDDCSALLSELPVQRLNQQQFLSFQSIALDCANNVTNHSTNLHQGNPTVCRHTACAQMGCIVSTHFHAVHNSHDGRIHRTISAT